MVDQSPVRRPRASGSVGAPLAFAKRALDRVDRPRPPVMLRENWTASPAGAASDGDDEQRLHRDRSEIVPWLARTHPLKGSRVLEVGCGAGLSTIALAEQGADVVGLDVDPELVDLARSRLAARCLDAELVVANAADLASTFAGRSFDWVVFWAALEHMTLDERLASLTAAWSGIERGGLLTIIETPNRLWYFDSHTARLPFYMWLPDELAYRTAGASPRAGFADRYGDEEMERMAEFQRRGRGVGHHELDVALDPQWREHVVSCMQLERRASNPLRRVGWRISRAGRYEAILRAVAPEVPRAFFQPMLYVTLRKP